MIEMPHGDGDREAPVMAQRATQRQQRLRLTRAGWLILVAASLSLAIAMLPAAFAAYQVVCATNGCQLTPEQAHSLSRVGVSITTYAVFNISVDILYLLASCVLAAIIFWRASDNWMALLVALLLVALAAVLIASSLEYTDQSWGIAAAVIDKIGLALALLIFALFPSGRFIPRWSWVIPVIFLATQVPLIIFSRLSIPDWLDGISYLLCFGSIIGGQIYRYRRVSNSVARRQTKWVVFGIVVTLFADLIIWQIYFVVPALHASDSLYALYAEDAFHLLIFLIPVTFAVATLRFRLYEIDVIISRTLVYGILTLTLAAIYFGIVLGAQAIIHTVTRTDDQPPLLIVASTLLVAALVQPLRRAIQTFIDKRFFRTKYDAAKTLTSFSYALNTEVDLLQLQDRLLVVVEETMRPESVSLWLRQPQSTSRE